MRRRVKKIIIGLTFGEQGIGLVSSYVPLIKDIKGKISFRHPIRTGIKVYHHFMADSLYRNSIYLMLSTFIMAFFGFFFWMINTRLFTADQVGIATAMISTTTLITSFSILGLNSGIIRFLPTFEEKNKLINTVFTLVGSTAFIIAILYVLFIDTFSPKLLFIQENLYLAVLFVVFITLNAVNIISDSVFVALRSTKYILIYSTLYSIVKLILPLFMVSLGAFGIYASYSIGVVIALLFTLYFLYRFFQYNIYLTIDKQALNKIAKFSLGNYSASFIGGLPTLIFPILILNKLGADKAAYHYMVMMIINLLNIIPLAISQSLFAEGSIYKKNIRELIIKNFKFNTLLLIPGIFITYFFGQYILLAFGRIYSMEGVSYLQIMAILSIFTPINYTFGVYYRIINKIKVINCVVLIGSIISISVSYFAFSLGLIGVSLGLFFGQIAQIIVFLVNKSRH